MGRVLISLVLLSALGVGASVWVWFYTEWFPFVGSLLGLGGVFTWLAFLSGILSEDRKKQLQTLFDRRVLGTWWFPLVLVVTSLSLAAGASGLGTVVVRSTADERDRTISLGPLSTDAESEGPSPRAFHLPPRNRRSLPVWTGWRERHLIVRVSGLPPQPLTLRPFERRVLEVPTSFRSGIRVTAPERVARNLERETFKLVVRLNGAEVVSLDPAKYGGREIWIGVPPEGSSTEDALILAGEREIQKGDRIRVELRRQDDEGVYVSGDLTLPFAFDDGVEEIELKVPTEGGE